MAERHDERTEQPMVKSRPEDTVFQSPFTAPPKPADAEEKSPQQKAAETRAKNRRAEERAERKAEREAAEAVPTSAESAGQRTWSCPQCGRGTTLGHGEQPPTIMLCPGCGRDSAGDTWLPPGMGHGEPSLPVNLG